MDPFWPHSRMEDGGGGFVVLACRCGRGGRVERGVIAGHTTGRRPPPPRPNLRRRAPAAGPRGAGRIGSSMPSRAARRPSRCAFGCVERWRHDPPAPTPPAPPARPAPPPPCGPFPPPPRRSTTPHLDEDRGRSATAVTPPAVPGRQRGYSAGGGGRVVGPRLVVDLRKAAGRPSRRGSPSLPHPPPPPFTLATRQIFTATRRGRW